MPDTKDEGFLLRWSRRKRAATEPDATTGEADTLSPMPASEAEPHHPPVPSSDAAEAAARGQSAEVEAAAVPAESEVPEDLQGVDVDTMTYESDFTRFMQKDVPEALRRRALRQLWRSDPVLANIDGLNDYDDDFTDAALAVKVLETAHKVGKGYLTDDDADDASEADRMSEGAPDAEAGELVSNGTSDADSEEHAAPDAAEGSAEAVSEAGTGDNASGEAEVADGVATGGMATGGGRDRDEPTA